MKANELMIGDWVKSEDTICRVWCIDWQLQLVRCHRNGQEWDTTIEEIKPIPLTEDILKANGWEVMGKNIGMVRCLYRLSDNVRIRIYLHYPYMLHYVDDTRTDGYEEREWSIGNITKVHELQHALRICGLNELADNFKIKSELWQS